jgi:hypothetical protein
MAIAIGAAGAVGAVVAARRRRASGTSGPDRGSAGEERYTCACGATYRTTGAGRHRVFWVVDAPAGDPVLEDHCPACGRAWPEEGGHATAPAGPVGVPPAAA